MARLYIKIYVAVLASLVLFALLAAAAWRLTADGDRFAERQEFYRAVAAQLAPQPQLTPDEQRRILQRWRELSGLEFAIFDRDGRARGRRQRRGLPPAAGGSWAGAGPPAPCRPLADAPLGEVVPLPDGRTVVAARPRPMRGRLVAVRAADGARGPSRWLSPSPPIPSCAG